MTNTLFIETTVLNSFLGEDSDVYVKIDNHFVRKKGRDLQEGDKIVVKIENIDKNPEEVYTVLDKHSVRYRLAKDILFENNSEERAIPKLRTLLWRSMADPRTQNLEAKVLLKNDDFTQGEYRDVADVLRDVVSVTRGTVQTWLAGEVIAPETWENFNALSSIGGDEGKEFAAIYHSKDHNTGFHAAYKLYVGLRSTIMSYLAKRTGEERDNSKRNRNMELRNASQKGKYTPEIEAVVRMFIDEIDHNYVAARVMKIKTVEKGSKTTDEKESPDPNLSKGIVATKPTKGIALPMQLIRDTHYLLETALIDILTTYADKSIFDIQNLEEYVVFSNARLYQLTQLLPVDRTMHDGYTILVETIRNDARTRGSHKEQIEQQLKEIEQQPKERYHQFMKDLGTGKVDELCHVKAGTIAELIDTINQYSSALPQRYYEMRSLMIKMNLASLRISDPKSGRKEKREAKREEEQYEQKINAIDKYLIREYNLHNTKHIFWRYHSGNILSTLNKYSPKFITEETRNPSKLQYAKQQYIQIGFRFFTRNETLFLLARAGYQDLITVYDKNAFI